MMSQNYRKVEQAAEDVNAERAVQSVSISRRGASRSSRVNRGGKRSVTRGRRQAATALTGLFGFRRVRNLGIASVRPRGTPWRPAKIASILLVVAVVVVLAMLYSNDTWYVYADDVHFRNLTYLDEAEVYRNSGLEGWHIFWLTPEQVSEMILSNPYVKRAEVAINLPLRIVVDVEEKQPIALWVTSDATYWLTEDGAALPAIAPTDETLPQIIDVLGEAKSIGPKDILQVKSEVLASALALMEQMPELQNKIRYNRNYGLNFPLSEEEVWVYWGDGQDTEAKMNNLVAAKRLLPEREEPATLIDVRFIQRPYVR